MNQQGDVFLFQTSDGGDITIEDGLVEMSGGLETAAYLSLFGGNEDDDGRETSPHTWWGNLGETDPALMYRSETQHLVQSLPATSNNLRRVEDAAKRDLDWLISKKVASTVRIVASIPRVNTVRIQIFIEADGLESTFDFVENWKATS